MKSILRGITTSLTSENLPVGKTIVQILKKEDTKEIKEKVKEYLDWLKKEYPGAKEGIERIWNDPNTQKEWKEYSNETAAEKWLVFIRQFTGDDDIIEKVKKEAEKELKQLSTSNSSDDDISKDLRTQPIDDLLGDFEFYKGDEVAFAVELYQKFYLGWLPKYIEKKLREKNPVLVLNDLGQENWKPVRQKLFTDFYASWKNTTEESEIEKLKEKLGQDIDKLDELIGKTRKSKKQPTCHIPEHQSLAEEVKKLQGEVTDLKARQITPQQQREITARELETNKEKAQKESSDGNPWDLTKEEKEKIDQAANQQDLAKVVAEMKKERDSVNPQDLAQANKWIEENITNKTKLADLPTEADIEKELGSVKLPPGFKEKAKQTLWKKRNELTPESTNIPEKIKELLVWFQGKADFLKKGIGGETEIKAFKKYSEAKIDQIMPLVDQALKTDTLVGYKLLDEEWLALKNKELKENNQNYNFKFDYFGVWKTLRGHLEATERAAQATKYNNLEKQVKGELGKNLGEKFLEAWEFKIEVKKD